MPKYNLSDADLGALADFVMALDFSKYQQKILKRSEVLKDAPLQTQLQNLPGALNGSPAAH
jgi:hypothetical protein